MSFIQLEINWLTEVIRFRAIYPSVSLGHFPWQIAPSHESKVGKVITSSSLESLNPPLPEGSSSAYSRFIWENKLNFADRLLLALTIAPQLLPDFLEAQILRVGDNPFWKALAGKTTHSGLIQSTVTKVYLPTALTYLYLLAGKDLIQRCICIHQILHKKSCLLRDNLISLSHTHPAEPQMGSLLMIQQEFLISLLNDREYPPNTILENPQNTDFSANI